MSLVNMSGKLDQAKNVSARIDALNAEVNKLKKDNDDVHNKLGQMSLQLQQMGKENAKLSEQMNEKLANAIDRKIFQENLDEVSRCFEEYVMNNTPRTNVVENFEEQLNDIRNEIDLLKKHPIVNIRTATDTEYNQVDIEVPELDLTQNKRNTLFKKPVKKN